MQKLFLNSCFQGSHKLLSNFLYKPLDAILTLNDQNIFFGHWKNALSD